MKRLVYLLFLLLLTGSSFNYRHTPDGSLPLQLDVKIQRPQTATSNDGVLSLTVSGGTAPYHLQVISTFSPSQVYKKEHVQLKKLGVGNYIIMVQDAEKQVLQRTIELTSMQ